MIEQQETLSANHVIEFACRELLGSSVHNDDLESAITALLHRALEIQCADQGITIHSLLNQKDDVYKIPNWKIEFISCENGVLKTKTQKEVIDAIKLAEENKSKLR